MFHLYFLSLFSLFLVRWVHISFHPSWVMAKYSNWRSTSQESKGKPKNISHSSFTSQSYQMALYTAIKRARGTKTRTVNWHAAVKKMFCLWSGLEGRGKKRGCLKGEGQDGGQRGQFACSQNWINVHLFPQEAFPLYSGGQGLKKRHNYFDGIQSSDLRWMTSCSDWGSTCQWRCPARQQGGCGGGGGTPGRRRLPSSWAPLPPSPFTSPPSQPASLPPSLQNWTQVSCCTAFTFADLRDAQCRKAGARLTLEVRVRARVRRAPHHLLLLKSTTTATEVSPSKWCSLGSLKGKGASCQICLSFKVKEMSVGAVTLIMAALSILLLEEGYLITSQMQQMNWCLLSKITTYSGILREVTLLREAL